MNINAKHGDKVVYIGSTDSQVNWGASDDPRGKLARGNQYVVDETEIHTWHTKVRLVGIEGRFPSVSFEDALTHRR